MNTTIRLAIVDHTIRWASNVLIEVTSNHGPHIPGTARDALKAAIESLAVASSELVQGEKPKPEHGRTDFGGGRLNLEPKK
jgi:hypothetical protein